MVHTENVKIRNGEDIDLTNLIKVIEEHSNNGILMCSSLIILMITTDFKDATQLRGTLFYNYGGMAEAKYHETHSGINAVEAILKDFITEIKIFDRKQNGVNVMYADDISDWQPLEIYANE